MVRSSERGPVVLGAKGKYYPAEDEVEGENPLKNFGENAAKHLRRMDSFDNTPDLLVVSMFDTEKEEVAAFEELIGSHGGIGGCQSLPFILYPSDWRLDNQRIIGAENVYKLFKAKIEESVPS